MNSDYRADIKFSVQWTASQCRYFFFRDGRAEDLAAYRIFFYSVVLFFLAIAPGWRDLSRAFWEPITLFRLFHLLILPDQWLNVVLWVTRLSLVFCIAGLFTVPSSFTALLGTAYLMGVPLNFGTSGHWCAILVLGLAIFACAHTADARSLDMIIFQRTEIADRSPEYHWPIKTFQLLTAMTLFSAAIAKIRGIGVVDWVTSDSLYYTFIRHYYTHQPPTKIGLMLSHHSWAIHVLAALTLAIEFSSIALPFLPVWHRICVLLGVYAMLLGFGLVLGIFFWSYLAVFACFLPWENIIRTLEDAFRPSSYRPIQFSEGRSACRITSV